MLVGMLCLAGASAAADDRALLRPLEIAASGGFADGPGYAGRAPLTGVSATFGMPWMRVQGGASYSWLTKAGTPGGFQRAYSYSVEAGHPQVFVVFGVSENHTDQTVWTKDVSYRFGGVGGRWTQGWRHERPLNLNEVRLLYYREHESTYANRTQLYTFAYNWDRLLTGGLYLRLQMRLGAMYFDDNPYPGAARRHGSSASFGAGVVLRP